MSGWDMCAEKMFALPISTGFDIIYRNKGT